MTALNFRQSLPRTVSRSSGIAVRPVDAVNVVVRPGGEQGARRLADQQSGEQHEYSKRQFQLIQFAPFYIWRYHLVVLGQTMGRDSGGRSRWKSESTFVGARIVPDTVEDVVLKF